MKTKLIGISGLKGSGKDFIAKIIIAKLAGQKVVRIAFADPLKKEVSMATGMSLEYMETYKANFRLILQGWGTDFRRALHGDDYWIKKWKAAVEYQAPETIVLSPDVRFENEYEAINQMGGFVIRVVAVGNKRVKPDSHPSENLFVSSDYAIENDFVTPDNTLKQVEELLKKI